MLRKNPWLTVALHVLCWSLFFILPFLFQNKPPAPPGNFPAPAIAERHQDFPYMLICLNALLVPLFYLNTELIFPGLLGQKKYGMLLVSQLGLIVVQFCALKWLVPVFLPDLGPRIPGRPNMLPIFHTYKYLFVVLIAFCYYLLRQNLASEQQQKEKETIQLKSELQFLRWQISPHFLFNVLNNMVALARVKSEKLEPMLLKLSTLMRYMLYETDGRRIALFKEAEYLQSYIFLQRIRLGDHVKVNVIIDVPENSEYYIEPMLLIPFVENAFKHGTGMIADPFIDIVMRQKDDVLSFEVQNAYEPQKADSKDDVSGIGLANVQRRLKLLYGKEGSLHVTVANGLYKCLLTIKLS